MKIYDLSQPLNEQVSFWPYYPPFEVKYIKRKAEHGVNAQYIQTSNHMGTHLDAPRHFVTAGMTIDEIPIEWLCGPGVLVDLRDEMDELAIYTPKMIEDRVEVKKGDLLFLHTGWEKHAQFGSDPDEEKYIHRHPGAHPDMVPWLLEKGIHIWGVDCISTDHPMNLPIGRFLGKGMHGHCDRVRKQCEDKFGGPEGVAKLFPDSAYQLTHNALFPKNCMHIENLGGDITAPELQNKRLILGCFPWKFKGGEAAFCRAVAFTGDWKPYDARRTRRRLGGHGEELHLADQSAANCVADRVEKCRSATSSRASLERVERLNPTLNAVVTLNPRAMDDARALDRAAGRRRRPGTALRTAGRDQGRHARRRPAHDVRLDRCTPTTSRLKTRSSSAGCAQAGAVILGKTNCPEFAAGGNTFNEVFGRTRNPWDPSKSAGGSTGGGAAALASGMIALAEGTDLGGSLRIPASFCGVVGLRPSVGLVPTHPTDWVWDTLQVTGPMARTAEDVALMLQAVAGPSEWSPLAQPAAGRDFVGAVARGAARGLRIAYCPDIAGIGIESSTSSNRVGRPRSDSKDIGASVEIIDLDLSEGRQAFLPLRGEWFVNQMFPRLDRQDRVRPERRGECAIRACRDHEGTGGGRGLSWPALACVQEAVLTVRSSSDAVHGRVAVSRRAELSGRDCRQADADVHRLDRADVRVEHDRTSSRVGSLRIG